MAQPYQSYDPRDDHDAPRGGDWQDLRGELLALLGEVEAQVARSRPRQPERGGIAERMRNLREQVTGGGQDWRHQEALRSVKRAVERFNERAETEEFEPPRMPPNPRDTLQSAIREIRSRQSSVAAPPRQDELSRGVDALAGRLERLEAELRNSARSQTGSVREIAEQVAQLSQVVELLAGAVGETGQVKRLEAQIAEIARLLQPGSRRDMGKIASRLDDIGATMVRLFERQGDQQVTQRLDDVTATMGRLADLQVQFANRVDASTQLAGSLKGGLDAVDADVRGGMQAIQAALSEGLGALEGEVRDAGNTVGTRLAEGMRTIEESVRNIYDRIDALERSSGMPTTELDALTAQMSQFTEALKQTPEPGSLVALAEDLNARIAAMEGGGHIGGLKGDAEALRVAVVEAMEPRFASLEMQIEALGERLGEAGGAPGPGIGQIEAQVRQLVARMDQTGEQLTGLARLYGEQRETSTPDFDALADLVASRASEAMARAVPAPKATGMAQADIDEIERRISRLMAHAAPERTDDERASIEASIREVGERLARLETTLARPSEAPSVAASGASTTIDEPVGLPEPAAMRESPNAITAATRRPDRDESARIETVDTPRPAGARDDAMPADPVVDAPLRDRPFDDPVPAGAPLDRKTGTPVLTGIEETSNAPTAGERLRPHFDPSAVERPPKPKSSFETTDTPAFNEASATASTEPERVPPVETDQPEPPPSANTFIAAARRAAQRDVGAKGKSGSTSGSLIARAFQRGQADQRAEAAPDADESKPWRKRIRKVEASKAAKAAKAPTDAPVDVVGERAPVSADHEVLPRDENQRPQSFFVRHRRVLLLGIAVAVIAALTLNLVLQRLGGAPTDTNAAGGPTLTPTAFSPEPLANATDSIETPRVIPIVDSLTTASVGPNTARGFSTAPAPQPGPLAFSVAEPTATAGEQVVASLPDTTDAAASAADAAAVAAIESPVEVDMPPEQLGPEALRRAAAHGDARAQFEIAAIYTEGRAIPEDLAAAAIWYERAAAQGFAPAQYRLGSLYENGRGVDRDLELARLWYQRAAEAGNRMAMHNLAALHAGGELGKQQFDTAAEWFEQAAELGMRDSQFNLGMLHARGLGVEQSLEKSYKWFAIAADRGDADAAKARDDVVRSLDVEAVNRLNEEISAYQPAPIDHVANFAPIGTWSDDFDPGEPITSAEVVTAVQSALNALGYDVGPPDGLAGSRTAEAIRAFERATGMGETGAVNPRLLAVLGSQPV